MLAAHVRRYHCNADADTDTGWRAQDGRWNGSQSERESKLAGAVRTRRRHPSSSLSGGVTMTTREVTARTDQKVASMYALRVDSDDCACPMPMPSP